MAVDRKDFVILTVFISVAAILTVTSAFLFLSQVSQSKAIETSKGTPEVQNYLTRHRNAECDVLRVLVRGDGAVYTVDEHWKPIRYVGHSGEPADGKDHHCWCVHWGDPESAIPEIVNVYVDRESGQTIIVERAT